METLRQDFPSLNHWPDSYILQQSASGLTKAHGEMENRSGRGGRPSLETRMARNFKISNGRKIQLPAGEDDRVTVIHEGRFLPGERGEGLSLGVEGGTVVYCSAR